MCCIFESSGASPLTPDRGDGETAVLGAALVAWLPTKLQIRPNRMVVFVLRSGLRGKATTSQQPKPLAVRSAAGPESAPDGGSSLLLTKVMETFETSTVSTEMYASSALSAAHEALKVFQLFSGIYQKRIGRVLMRGLTSLGEFGSQKTV